MGLLTALALGGAARSEAAPAPPSLAEVLAEEVAIARLLAPEPAPPDLSALALHASTYGGAPAQQVVVARALAEAGEPAAAARWIAAAAEALAPEGRDGEARAELAALVARHGGAGLAARLLADVAPDDAVAAWDAVHAAAVRAVALEALAQGDAEGARRALAGAWRRGPDSAAVWRALMPHAATADVAAREAELALASRPGLREAQELLVDARWAQGAPESALPWLDGRPEAADLAARASWLGRVAAATRVSQAGRGPRAVAALREAAQRAPAAPWAAAVLAEAWRALGRPAEARRAAPPLTRRTVQAAWQARRDPLIGALLVTRWPARSRGVVAALHAPPDAPPLPTLPAPRPATAPDLIEAVAAVSSTPPALPPEAALARPPDPWTAWGATAFEVSARAGVAGTTSLTAGALPVRAGAASPGGAVRLWAEVTPLALTAATSFDAGVAPRAGVAVAHGPVSVTGSLGATALGAAVPGALTWDAAVEFALGGGWSLAAAGGRAAVRDTRLSWVGVVDSTDPETPFPFGRLTRTLGGGAVRWEGGAGWLDAGFQAGVSEGLGVRDTGVYAADADGGWRGAFGLLRVAAGARVHVEGHAQRLDGFGPGQAGAFSPALLVRGGPVLGLRAVLPGERFTVGVDLHAALAWLVAGPQADPSAPTWREGAQGAGDLALCIEAVPARGLTLVAAVRREMTVVGWRREVASLGLVITPGRTRLPPEPLSWGDAVR